MNQSKHLESISSRVQVGIWVEPRPKVSHGVVVQGETVRCDGGGGHRHSGAEGQLSELRETYLIA